VSRDQHGVYLSSSQQHSDADSSSGSGTWRTRTSPVPFACTSPGDKEGLGEGGEEEMLGGGAAVPLSSLSSSLSGSGVAPTAVADAYVSPSAVPPFISAISLHPQCTDLGTIFVCRCVRYCCPPCP
jgi:hypothetical protein